MTLKFSKHNSKLNKLAEYLGIPKTHVVSFDLPAGYTCPAADICLSRANRKTGKITDGAHTQYRCYAASVEARFPTVRKAHWHNRMALDRLSTDQMVELISESLPARVEVVRIHSSGDFFSQEYFDAWVGVARMNPDIIFFGYTKILPYVSADIPDNMSLVYSHGGVMDNQVTNEPVCYVVNTFTEAVELGVQVACEAHPADDFDFIRKGLSFALEIHGTQPAQ